VSFDNSRFTFDPWKNFSGVVMEQGRVQLDADWNEWLAEVSRRIQANTLDIMGHAVYPATTPYGFLITLSSSGGKELNLHRPGTYVRRWSPRRKSRAVRNCSVGSSAGRDVRIAPAATSVTTAGQHRQRR